MGSMGVLALMGSGELTATMVEVHKELLARLRPAPDAVFLDTPAGFQLNVAEISRKAAEYFRTRVKATLSPVSLRSAVGDAFQAESAYHALRRAHYILVGPGSPTYAIRQWRQTPVPDIFAERLEEGGCLVAASAAALTMGRRAVPVYEIYKVGEDPHWAEGIDLLGRFGLDLAVIPHWNNAEGGTHDTRFCYLGEPRFRLMEEMLPDGVGVLGIDEHTACIVDLEAQSAEVRGIGRVTVRRRGAERVFERGARFPLDVLRGEGAGEGWSPAAPPPASSEEPDDAGVPFRDAVRRLEETFHRSLDAEDAPGAANAVLDLDRLLWGSQGELDDESALADAREVFRESMALLGARLASAPASREACLGPLVEALLAVRDEWRREARWAEADALRRCLEEQGVTVEDSRDGSRWRFAT